MHSTEHPDLNLLSGMAMLLHSCPDENALMEVTEQYLPNMFPDASGALFFLRGKEPHTPAVTWGAKGALADELNREDCLALDKRVPHPAGDLDGKADTCAHICASPPFASLCLPLVTQNEPLGLLSIVHATADGPPLAEIRHKTGLAIATTECLALALSNIRLRKLLSDQATKDPLTGLYNRRHMRRELKSALASAERRETPLSIALLDIDHFKHFNDDYGHEAGDEVLVAVSATLRTLARAGCTSYRFGGEEMLVLMPDTDHDAAMEAADRLRMAIATLAVPHDSAALPKVTASFGVATWPGDGRDSDSLIKSADERLYASKDLGRDRVTGRS